jgi:translocator protein
MGWIHYILAPLFYLSVALFGRAFASRGVMDWYPTLSKPWLTPPGGLIGVVWSIIYILSAISLIVFINKCKNTVWFWPIIGLYILNGVVNALWGYVFFGRHMLGLAVVDAVFIWATVALLVLFTWRRAFWAGLVLVPYFTWATFAFYLSYSIWRLNGCGLG